MSVIDNIKELSDQISRTDAERKKYKNKAQRLDSASIAIGKGGVKTIYKDGQNTLGKCLKNATWKGNRRKEFEKILDTATAEVKKHYNVIDKDHDTIITERSEASRKADRLWETLLGYKNTYRSVVTELEKFTN